MLPPVEISTLPPLLLSNPFRPDWLSGSTVTALPAPEIVTAPKLLRAPMLAEPPEVTERLDPKLLFKFPSVVGVAPALKAEAAPETRMVPLLLSPWPAV